MGLVDKIVEDYIIPVPKPDTWRHRFQDCENWATANAWDDEVKKPDDNEIKLCISEVFQAINMACAGFRFIENKTGDITAKSVADILSGQ